MSAVPRSLTRDCGRSSARPKHHYSAWGLRVYLHPSYVNPFHALIQALLTIRDQDISWFVDQCHKFGTLKSLIKSRFSLDNKMLVELGWSEKILELLKDSPLLEFELSSAGGELGVKIGTGFCDPFTKAHGARLRRFSVYRLYMDPVFVREICRYCVNLEELFVTMEQDELVSVSHFSRRSTIDISFTGLPGTMPCARQETPHGSHSSTYGHRRL